MATLSEFIRKNTEEILSEWETFARNLPIGSTMDIAALRDHAKQMLKYIVKDLETPQTGQQQADKAQGRSDTPERSPTSAAQAHGAGRAQSGFSVEEMVAEFRALRASVIRLWTRQNAAAGVQDLEDMIRFNEAIDQAIAESITKYTEDISQSKARFLAILGHDLRTPIGAIITSSQFMLDTAKLQEPYLALVSGMAGSARRMNQMVADLLDYTRTSFGDMFPIERKEVDIAHVLHDVVTEVLASNPKAEIEVDAEGDLSGSWDAARLAQVFTNIVGNGVEHGAGAGPVTIKARRARANVIVSVQNNGPLIPKDELTRIFEPMVQGAIGDADRQHLGLGLYIVDKIVEAHGGSVSVESNKKRGTTFTVELPHSA